MSPPKAHAQRGAALLAAMLTVALVASLASAAVWLQWRQVEVEIAERGRAQTQWLMVGALDWTRLILAEDANTSPAVDHLGEPWALPVQESKLSTFLSQDQQWREGDPEIFLSGQIHDAQARLNLTALVQDGQPSASAVAAWTRLFVRLQLPMDELHTLLQQWPRVLAAHHANGQERTTNLNADARAQLPLLPQRLEQLGWLGLSPDTIAQLQPYATVLPTATPVNLNTAPAPVLEAVVPGLDGPSAQQLVVRRSQRPWNSLAQAAEAMGAAGKQLDPRSHSVQSSYFEIHGRLRQDAQVQEEHALVERQGAQVRMVWRIRMPPALAPTASLQSFK
jgi:general secretion pathway protein K